MLKIRLMRIGGKQRPFYRVVAVDERSKRTGAYIELLGTYNPLTEQKEIKLKQDRIDYWTKQGAQPSVGYLRIIGKAPQRQPRKPKKEKQPAAVSPQPAAEQQNETQVQKEATEFTAEESAPKEQTPEPSTTEQPVPVEESAAQTEIPAEEQPEEPKS